MSAKVQIPDILRAIETLAEPTVLRWNRLEGRPRSPDFQRAMRAEVRDAMWMLCRQWQLGEFEGEDCGSPVKARLHMRQTGYPLHVMHQYSIEPDEASDFCRMVAKRDIDSLDSIEVVSRNRRALLPYGALVLDQVIKVMNPSMIVMSAQGSAEGVETVRSAPAVSVETKHGLPT